MTTTPPDGDGRANARDLAAASLAAGNPTAWFEQLYAAAQAGTGVVPWADGQPSPLLVRWPHLPSPPRRTCVVGCGYGDDAEFLAGQRFSVTAFDIAPSAIEGARRRFAGSAVLYRVADVMAPPSDLVAAFDLVVELFTLQSLPSTARRDAISGIASLVAPGGTLLVVARARDASEPEGSLPWPLTRAEIDSFTAYGLRVEDIEDFMDDEQPSVRRWRATFTRPASAA
ncbi:MAG: hypothetical protein QOJ62_639 [Actinomycetota bacterium]|nr:hypothetical protein [Actinomycetota bacterium]